MLSFSFHFIVSFNVKTSCNNFFSSMSEFLACSRQYHDACVCIPLFGNKLQCLHMHVSCYSREYAAETYTEEKNYWIKLLILFSLCTKYSRSFINVRLKHWCHYPYYLSGSWMCQFCCCRCRVGKLSNFIAFQICVLKMNKCLMGLEQHGWVINDRISIVWKNYSLNSSG